MEQNWEPAWAHRLAHRKENRLGIYLAADLDCRRALNWVKLMVRPKELPTENRWVQGLVSKWETEMVLEKEVS